MIGRRLFVYGTLLSGEPNARFLAGATRVGAAATVALFDLIDLGGYPALRAGGRTSVRGEVYLVGDRQLPALDELEGHPTLFVRAPIALAGGDTAEAYLVPPTGLSLAHHTARVIPGGDWRRHRRAR